MSSISVIIVTHNSERFLPKAMQALHNQTRAPDQILLVDTGSDDLSYLEPYNATIHLAEKGAGFCKGNNLGYQNLCNPCDYVFLVNPDLFLAPDYIEKALAWMERPANRTCGALTGTTLGYDIQNDRPTGLYDTTGIFSSWYGRWYDRAQREPCNPHRFQNEEEIPAICGAVFFCRRQALDQVLLRNSEILDSSFYMYKEDIDLSLRLRKKGWKLFFVPQLMAYHCRGWSLHRKEMPRQMRLSSAANELRIHGRMRMPHKIFYSALKWSAVRFFDA